MSTHENFCKGCPLFISDEHPIFSVNNMVPWEIKPKKNNGAWVQGNFSIFTCFEHWDF